MPDVSSPGSALPNIKTINVEANLLGEWLAKRDRVREEVVRYLMLIGGVAAIALVALPVLWRVHSSAQAATAKAEKRMKQLGSTLAQYQSQKDEASPRLAHQEMLKTTRVQADEFLGQMVLLMNAASTDMAFGSVQADILGGQMTVRCKADAQDFATTRKFVTDAGVGPGVKSAVLVSSRSSELLGSNGVSFEFIKRLEVGQ
jgi:hypothetical protein